MNVGMQLVSERGYNGLLAGETYYFLSNNQELMCVNLVFFSLGKDPKSILLSMSALDFENGLLSGRIVCAEKQWGLPPWLRDYEEINIYQLERQRKSNVISYADRVVKRFMYISGALELFGGGLSDPDLDSKLNKYARELSPAQHAKRIRFWFYTYILFGRNIWSLMSKFSNIGHWDRQEVSKMKKLGRKPLHEGGQEYGVTKEMLDMITEGYALYSKQLNGMEKIYGRVVCNVFGCESIVVSRGEFKYIQKEGKPFPSLPQFRYHVTKSFSQKSRQILSFGEEAVRTKISGSVGKFSERLSNLLQRVELDAYYSKARPVGLIEGNVMDPLCVVRAVCSVSGYLVGIGFSFDKEDMSGYLMALFSMAIKKSEFFRLFGMSDLDDDDWQSTGLSTNIIVDRGPGAAKDLFDDCKWINSRNLPPSYSGQSKASIESSHPRVKSIEGRPKYRQSNLNVVQMAKNEIKDLVESNWTSDATARCTPEMINHGVSTTPAGIYGFLDSRARTDAYPMSFEEAVRNFLKPIKVSLRQDAVYFHHRRFNSVELQQTGIFDGVGKSDGVEVDAYLLEMCVRHLWVEINGRLYELDALLPIRDDTSQLYVSLADLCAEEHVLKVTHSKLRQSKPAVASYYDQKFEAATGKASGAVKLQEGVPSKGDGYKREVADLKRNLSGKS
ncbi:hypothetical protein D3C85_205060 [compost metagenome]